MITMAISVITIYRLSQLKSFIAIIHKQVLKINIVTSLADPEICRGLFDLLTFLRICTESYQSYLTADACRAVIAVWH